MNWIKNVVRPRINNFLRRETPENLWIKCPETGQMVFHKDVAENQWVIPDSGAHLKISAHMRLHLMFDEGAYDVLPTPSVPTDPLKFKGRERYVEKLKAAQAQTNLSEAFLSGFGKLEGIPVVIGAHDMDFIAGTLGMAVGEAVIAAAEKAREHKTPLILFTSSGGARMQEGLFSLMQMPRTTIAIRRLREARLPYVVVLTNPTTGGVTASYAMLGDVHLAEPGALIGFAGPRVIEQTVREKLPEGFQKAEYLKAHGMIDEIVPRQKLRAKIGAICRILKKLPPENRTES